MDYCVGLLNLGRRWRGPWGLRKSVEALAVLGVLVAGLSIFFAIGRHGTLGQILFGKPSRCKFPAIFNFGDSNSDTGGKSAAFVRLLSPNGDTFFGKPAGRYCDGEVVIDFIGDHSHFPMSMMSSIPIVSQRCLFAYVKERDEQCVSKYHFEGVGWLSLRNECVQKTG